MSKRLKVFLDVDGVKDAVRDLAGLDRALESVGESAETAGRAVDVAIENTEDAAREAAEAAKKAAADTERALRQLGVRSEATARQQKLAALEAYKSIKASGVATPDDIARAYEAMKSRIDKINRSLTRDADARAQRQARAAAEAADAATRAAEQSAREQADAHRRLGLTTAASAEKQKRELIAAYKTIKDAGTETPEDLARAWESLKEKLNRINKSISRTAETEAERSARKVAEAAEIAARAAEQSAKDQADAQRLLGVITRKTANDQIASITAAYERIRDDATSTADDVARAWEAAQEQIERINRRVTRNVETRWDRLIRSVRRGLARLAASVSLASAALGRLSARSAIAGLNGVSGGFMALGRSATSAASMVGRAASAIASGIQRVTVLGGKMFGGAVLGGGGASMAFLKSVADTSGEFERIATALQATTGKDFERASAFVTRTAEGVVYSQEQIAQSLLTLRNFGFGQSSAEVTLPALIDQVSKLGGSYEDLEGITLALGQAWAKQKLQGEEILQLVERGIPVWELLEKVTGKSVQEIQKLSEAGKLGRDTMALLIQEIGKSAKGAAAGQLNTYGGLVAQLTKAWDALKRVVGASGVFDAVKIELKGWIDYLGQPATIAVATKFAEVGVEAFQVLSGGIRRLVNEFGPRSIAVLRSWIQKASAFFNGMLDAAGPLFDGMVDYIQTSFVAVGNFVSLLVSVAKPALEALQTVIAAVSEGLAALNNQSTGDFAAKISEGIKSAVVAIGKILGDIDKEAVKEVADAVGNLIERLGKLSVEIASGEGMGAALATFRDLLSDIATLINNGLGGSFNTPMMQSIQELADTYLPKIQSAIESVRAFFANPGEGLANGLMSLLQSIAFDFIPWLAGLLKQFMDTLVQTMFSGIGSFFSGIGDWLTRDSYDATPQLEAILRPAPAPVYAPIPGTVTPAVPVERIAIDMRLPSGGTATLEGSRSAVDQLRREQARLKTTMSY